ncbi:MAG TPA: DNA gyrase inhibitor YacG [Sphingomicrobium sp.]|nr:DNA gyrase inhibitor YacG [Sphingomicrobium sp.]
MPNPSDPTKNCPLCGAPEQRDFAPFCSRGCKDRDLLKWLGEGYRIPGPPADVEQSLGRVDSDEGDR